MNDEKNMNYAIIQAKKALKKEEIPIGCIITKNGKIIAKAYNNKEKTNMCCKHAEMTAIAIANKKTKNWRLNDCTLYCTIEPCMMCSGAIIQSRIKKVYFGYKNDKFGFLEESGYKNFVNMQNEECVELLRKFFDKKRK